MVTPVYLYDEQVYDLRSHRRRSSRTGAQGIRQRESGTKACGLEEDFTEEDRGWNTYVRCPRGQDAAEAQASICEDIDFYFFCIIRIFIGTNVCIHSFF